MINPVVQDHGLSTSPRPEPVSARASPRSARAWSIGRIGASAAEGIARQPEADGKIRGIAIILAAFIEGVALFAVVVTLLIATA